MVKSLYILIELRPFVNEGMPFGKEKGVSIIQVSIYWLTENQKKKKQREKKDNKSKSNSTKLLVPLAGH